MMKGSKQFPHVIFSHFFTKYLILLLSNLLKELSTTNVLHHKVDVLLIYVRLIIFYDIWMVKFGENPYFLLDCLEMIFKLVFIKNFDSNLMTCIMFVVS
mgnify:CR=1 FL=1